MSHTNSTPNYALPEFLSSDKPAWMADINVAFSDIDTAMKNNADAAAQANTDNGTLSLNFAAGYSNSSTYDVGDVVVYNKRMYICDVAVTVPEAFDNGKWSYYRVSDTADAVANVSAAENSLETLVGSTDISAIGDGTCTGAIDAINSNLSDSGWLSNSSIFYRKIGSIVTVTCDAPAISANTWTTIGTLPAGYRPKEGFTTVSNVSTNEWYRINANDGTVQFISTSANNYGFCVTFIVA